MQSRAARGQSRQAQEQSRHTGVGPLGYEAALSRTPYAGMRFGANRKDRSLTKPMLDPSELLIEPNLRLVDGRVIGSIGDAIALLREHESRPGVDNRDEVLHRLERAQTDKERQAAAEGFFGWANELGLLPAKPMTSG